MPHAYASTAASRPPPQDWRPGGSLLLSCRTLSFPATCRFIPAHGQTGRFLLKGGKGVDLNCAILCHGATDMCCPVFKREPGGDPTGWRRIGPSYVRAQNGVNARLIALAVLLESFHNIMVQPDCQTVFRLRHDQRGGLPERFV